MAMDWDKLRVFHAVAEAGSFTHAGETLNLSQSAVSRQISALEEALAVPLFGQIGPLGAVWLRLAWAAVILLAAIRPRPWRFRRPILLATVALGAVTAGVTILFMEPWPGCRSARPPPWSSWARSAWPWPAAWAAGGCCGRVWPRPACCC